MLSNETMQSGKQFTKPPTNRLAAVIVILKQSPSELERCVRALNEQTLPIKTLYIHWNTPKPKHVTFSASFTIQHIGSGENVGWCRAINAGMAAAIQSKCTALLILNTDTTLPKKLMSTLVSELETYNAGAISPTILSPNKQIWYAGAQLFSPLGIIRIPHIGQPRSLYRSTRPTGSISGCCCLVSLLRCSDVRMNPDYFIYWDDPDLSRQIQHLGMPTLWTNLVAITHINGSKTITPFQAYGYMRNSFIFLRQFSPMPWRALGFVAQFLVVFPYHLLRCRSQKSKANLLRGLIDGALGKKGVFPPDLLP